MKSWFYLGQKCQTNQSVTNMLISGFQCVSRRPCTTYVRSWSPEQCTPRLKLLHHKQKLEITECTLSMLSGWDAIMIIFIFSYKGLRKHVFRMMEDYGIDHIKKCNSITDDGSFFTAKIHLSQPWARCRSGSTSEWTAKQFWVDRQFFKQEDNIYILSWKVSNKYIKRTS
jgi:hypothetical protein